MKRCLTVSMLAFSILIIAPFALAEEKPLPGPGLLSVETIFTSQRLSRYTTVVVNDFDISTAETEHIDEDERKILDTMKPGMVKILSESLVKNLKEKNQFKTVVRNAKGVKNAVRVEGRFSMLNGGIGGVKWLLFFMAPKNAKTYTTVVGRLVDADTGQELALFEETNTTSLHFKNFEEGFPEEADHIGEDIAEFVSLLY